MYLHRCLPAHRRCEWQAGIVGMSHQYILSWHPVTWKLGAVRITLWASSFHFSSITKVRSGHWCYIKETYPDTFIIITTLLIPEGAHLKLIFSGLRISCWAATILPDTRKTWSRLLPATTVAQQAPPWRSGRGGETAHISSSIYCSRPPVCYIFHDSGLLPGLILKDN